MKILWSDFASETLRDIYKYYKTAAGIPIAKKIKTEIFLATKQLKSQPESGQIEISWRKSMKGTDILWRGIIKSYIKKLRKEF